MNYYKSIFQLNMYHTIQFVEKIKIKLYKSYPPSILILSFQRINFKKNIKIERIVKIEEIIDISNYIDNDFLKNTIKYKLVGY